MKITKLIHSCLLVEMPEPVNRTVLFDPGEMSKEAVNVDSLQFLDDIVITHGHPDHFSPDLVRQLVSKFPDVRVTTTPEVAERLKEHGISASTEPADGMVFFDSPHEKVGPVYPQPQEIGVHYLDMLTHPGDSHNFAETKQVLALPVTGPWGGMINAVNVALKLKPKHIIPIHDWHWRDEAREDSYQILEKLFADAGITFYKMKTGEPIVIDL